MLAFLLTIINLCEGFSVVVPFSFLLFGLFIGLLLGFARPTQKKGYNTAAIINTLAVFAGGAILTIYGKGTENLIYFLIVGGFSIGGIVGFLTGRFIMERFVYPIDRRHDRDIEKIKLRK